MLPKLETLEDKLESKNKKKSVGSRYTHSQLTCSCVGPDATAEQRTDRILKVMSKLASRELKVCEEVYEAEMKVSAKFACPEMRPDLILCRTGIAIWVWPTCSKQLALSVAILAR